MKAPHASPKAASDRYAFARIFIPVPVEAVFFMPPYFKDVSAGVNAPPSSIPACPDGGHCMRLRFVEHTKHPRSLRTGPFAS
jgi:hypothetical protein